MRCRLEIAKPSLRLTLCGFLLVVQGIFMIPRSIEASSSSSLSAWKSAPWQGQEGGGEDSSSSSLLLEQLKYNGLSPTIFSPTGRLHPVEKTMEEVKASSSNNVVVALVCQDGILMLSTVPLSPHLNTTTILTGTSTPLSLAENNHSNNNTTHSTSHDDRVIGTSLFLSGTISAEERVG